ncbi:MAG TPA: hypothetical protein VI306_13660 [Pyrinomonadaceae bacterium]
MTHLSRSSRLLIEGTITLAVSLSFIALVMGQAPKNKTANSAEEAPMFQEYRGVQIGWLADDVRKKLGNPESKNDEQDFYIFNDKETAQFFYDKTSHKVMAISVDFMTGATGVPTPQQVFGADFETKPDGSKHKVVQYPKAGCWVSYSRTSGDTPLVTITIQKL